MIFYTSSIACVIIAGILVLHVLCFLLRSHVTVVLNIVNMCLHIALIPMLLGVGAELSELVVIFMGSLALHLVLSFFAVLSYKNESGGKTDDV